MRRLAIMVSACAVLAFSMPAHAGATRGRVAIAVGHPTVPVAAWSASPGSNGITGWVFPLDRGADERSYVLRRLAGMTGAEILDAYFYEDRGDGSGPGAPCAISVRENGRDGESGVICPGPQVGAWGVVVLVAGADARFTLTY